MIAVEHLVKRFGDVVAVDDVSFEVGEGEIVALLGPNGAGKTTTIKSILNLMVPDSGRITIGGRVVKPGDHWLYRHISGVLEGNRNIYWRLTVEQNLQFFVGLSGKWVARRDRERLLERFGLLERRGQEARKLSRGMQQKLAVLCVLVRGTDYIVLDEPTLGLDVDTTYQLADMIRFMKDSGRTLLVSSHNMKFVERIADRVVFINRGRVVAQGGVDELRRMFAFRTYSIRVVGRGNPGQLFPDARVEQKENAHVIHISLEPEHLYDVVDKLRSHGFLLEEIRRDEPDLEEIYLKVIGGEA